MATGHAYGCGVSVLSSSRSRLALWIRCSGPSDGSSPRLRRPGSDVARWSVRLWSGARWPIAWWSVRLWSIAWWSGAWWPVRLWSVAWWPTIRSRSETGAVVPLMAIVLVVTMMLGLLVGVTAQYGHRQAAAQWAADAAAMAAAVEGVDATGPSSGRGLARANGGTLISAVLMPPQPGPDDRFVSMIVVVEVEFDGVRATAAAVRVVSG